MPSKTSGCREAQPFQELPAPRKESRWEEGYTAIEACVHRQHRLTAALITNQALNRQWGIALITNRSLRNFTNPDSQGMCMYADVVWVW